GRFPQATSSIEKGGKETGGSRLHQLHTFLHTGKTREQEIRMWLTSSSSKPQSGQLTEAMIIPL
ncbi:hypothetical protein Tco_0555046, partial [Tanacetum coccineum]